MAFETGRDGQHAADDEVDAVDAAGLVFDARLYLPQARLVALDGCLQAGADAGPVIAAAQAHAGKPSSSAAGSAARVFSKSSRSRATASFSWPPAAPAAAWLRAPIRRSIRPGT
eukprot:gene30742-38002_t